MSVGTRRELVDAKRDGSSTVSPVQSEKGLDLSIETTNLQDDVLSSLPALEKQEKTSGQKSLTRLHVAALCSTMFLIGWFGGTLGPLLPRIQDVYGVRVIAILTTVLLPNALSAK